MARLGVLGLVNVRVPPILRLSSESYIACRVDPETLAARGELAHWRLSSPEECELGRLGEIVLPSESVDLVILSHELYHAALDISIYHVPVEVSTLEEEIAARHEAGALIMEKLIEQVLFSNNLSANALGGV